jgi:2Fe-2S iron-sulfur cluster binding domain/Pyridine nucleotide-disulphide oxidoreductase
MAGRLKPLTDPVTIELDGEPVRAERGEPLVCALVASGNLALARSPKFHRPRGPSCLRGACDGCLARVDERPNIMTCMVATRDGMQIRTQNTLGSRNVDLLRMTDWFFPDGLNHHELFAGIPGVQPIMQSCARRVAGLGRLPAEAARAKTAVRRKADVVIVGSGPAGMAVAARAVAKGRAVEVIEDHLHPGGSLRALGAAGEWSAIQAGFDDAVTRGEARVRASTTAGALYGDDLLVVGPEGAEVVEPSALVLAPGAHDGVLAFEGNDLPGVMSARAACWLLAHGVLVGAKVLVIVPEGGGPFGEVFARAARDACEVVVVRGEPLRASGSGRVTGCTVREGARERKVKADALLVDAPRAPAYELAEQAGARLVHTPRGYTPHAPRGKIRDRVYLAGEAAGVPLDAAAIAEHADEVTKQI